MVYGSPTIGYAALHEVPSKKPKEPPPCIFYISISNNIEVYS